MLSERMLTTAVRSCATRFMNIKPCTEPRIPGPNAGQRYMLYAHIPFCERLCPYCSFNRFPFSEKRAVPYFKNLRAELMMVKELGYDFDSLYIGGGTPTIMIDELCDFVDLAKREFSIKEVSCETNPNHLIPSYLDKLQGRVDRLSVGVQSFDNGLLKQMDRYDKYGSGESILESIKVAAPYFKSLNVDMIFNFPGQTPEMFEADVQTAVDLGVTHVSVYPLTIEDHTPFRRMVDSGEIDDVDQDKEALMMSMAPNVLTPAGFHRYEVASYAREGFECKHNIAYWTGVPYLGLGISAVTMTQNDARRMRVQDGEVQDDLDRKQMCAEDLMMKMRMTRGVSDDELFAAAVVIPGALDVFNSLVRDKLVKREDGRWKPTFGGWLLGNELYGRIYELAP